MHNNDDQIIVEVMHEQVKNNHYQRYLQDRFLVDEIQMTDHGLCAYISDHETGVMMKLHTGDRIADGQIEVSEEGVLFSPPRADVPDFVLPAKAEMNPVGAEGHRKFRSSVNEMLKRETRPKDDLITLIIDNGVNQ